jgi:hypothetical protein
MKLYLLSAILALGTLAQLPASFNASISASYLVTVNVGIQGWEPSPFLINNHANRTLAWTQACRQSGDLAESSTEVNCTAAPTLVAESLNT